jgi:hypothetical protein
MKPPAPYHGNKHLAGAMIWAALGDPANYVAPFSGLAGDLFARPCHGVDFRDRVETINDADGLVANALRAIRLDVEAVIPWCDLPVIEVDLHSVHLHLVASARDGSLADRLSADMDYCDPKLAGLWLWAKSCWFGDGFGKNPPARHIPMLSGGGGVGKGYGQGVHRGELRWRLAEYMREVAARLRYVRIICGDWKRAVLPTLTVSHGLTGVLLDPPYGKGAVSYAHGGTDDALLLAARDWAIANGQHELLRIVLCCYDDTEMPDSWRCVPWKAHGHSAGGERERLWLSPNCLSKPQPLQGSLL